MSCVFFIPFVLIFLLTPAFAEDVCLQPPGDPTDCKLVGAARARYETARAKFKQNYLETGGTYDPSLVECLSGVLNYVSACDHTACFNYNFSMNKKLAQGWGEERMATFVGEPGSCTLSRELSSNDMNIISPTGVTVLHMTRDAATGSHRRYDIMQTWHCTAPDLSSERHTTITEQGMLVIDNSTRQPTSRYWGKQVLVDAAGEPSVRPFDTTTLRINWPGGAIVDLGSDGKPRSSNFLTPSYWDPAQCQTLQDTQKHHYYPSMTLAPDQDFAKVAPDFSKR